MIIVMIIIIIIIINQFLTRQMPVSQVLRRGITVTVSVTLCYGDDNITSRPTTMRSVRLYVIYRKALSPHISFNVQTWTYRQKNEHRSAML